MDFCKYINNFNRKDLQEFYDSMPGINFFVEKVEPIYVRGHKVLKVESEVGASYFTDFGLIYSLLPNGAKSITISNEYLEKSNNPIEFRQPVDAKGTNIFAYYWVSFVSEKLSTEFATINKYNKDLKDTCRSSISKVHGLKREKLINKLKNVTSPKMVNFIKSLNLFPQSAKVGV